MRRGAVDVSSTTVTLLPSGNCSRRGQRRSDSADYGQVFGILGVRGYVGFVAAGLTRTGVDLTAGGQLDRGALRICWWPHWLRAHRFVDGR